jgi:hypothetical protein
LLEEGLSMANAGTATIELKVTGNLPVIAKAFGVMSAALAAYGHEFTDDEMTTIATAADELTKSSGLDIEANREH